jgi:photosystem II stability/assembly factor-like uncharacterized protein
VIDEDRLRTRLQQAIGYEPPSPSFSTARPSSLIVRRVASRNAMERRNSVLLAFVAGLISVAIVVTLIFGARALHLTPSVPVHPGPPAPVAVKTEICQAQCEVNSQHALQPKPAAIRQCGISTATGCAVQAPFFASPSLGWISNSFTGPDGPAFLYRTDDAGQLWRPVLSWDGPGAEQIRSSADGQEALIVTAWGSHPGTIFHTSDAGTHWTARGLPVGAASDSIVYFLNPAEGWVLSANLDLIHTIDGGTNWTRVARLEGVQQGGNLLFLTSSNGVYVQPPTVDVTHDGGATWRATSPARPEGVPVGAFVKHAQATFFNSQDGMLELDYCTVALCPSRKAFAYRTSDGGSHWSLPVSLPAGVGRMIFIDTNHWIGIFGDVMSVRSVIRTSDVGQHWTDVASADGSYSPWDLLEPMGFTDPLHGWALGASGGYRSLLITSDGGITWIARALPT